MNKDTAVILLAGGVGTRMQSHLPKQYLPLNGKPLALYSYDVFKHHPRIAEIVVVCDPAYRHLFGNASSFALPGMRRQDSMANGFYALKSKVEIVCIHDAARPFISGKLVDEVIDAAQQFGAASLGVPVRFTVKQCTAHGLVKSTLERSQIWEIQTPQVLKKDLLQKGLEKIAKEELDVTDDVALAELLGAPVKIVHGTHANIKITTPEDLTYAEFVLNNAK